MLTEGIWLCLFSLSQQEGTSPLLFLHCPLLENKLQLELCFLTNTLWSTSDSGTAVLQLVTRAWKSAAQCGELYLLDSGILITVLKKKVYHCLNQRSYSRATYAPLQTLLKRSALTLLPEVSVHSRKKTSKSQSTVVRQLKQWQKYSL